MLDDTGWEILRALQENARIPFSELGRRVGLSSPAVAERVRRMEDAGIIAAYRAEIDPARIGLSITSFIRFVAPKHEYAYFQELVRALPEVLECHHVTGSDCFLLKVVVATIPHLEALVGRLATHGETVTMIVLSSPVTSRRIERDLLASARAAEKR